jgi:hypothetical protein
VIEFSPGSDIDALHDALFSGAIVRLRATTEMSALVSFTRAFLEEWLSPCVPERIHEIEGDLAQTCASIQREYSDSTEVKQLWKSLFEAIGLDPSTTTRDRITLRFQPPAIVQDERKWTRGTSTAGFHRDTWGTNLYAQVNWWAPIYPITAKRTFAILPELFAQPLVNNSQDFDIVAVIERSRGHGRPLGPGEGTPRLVQEIDLSGAHPVTIEPGEFILFSSQHAHAGIPNQTDFTRVSVEVRSLRLTDLEAGRGAPNVDGKARWISYGMFRRIADGKALQEILGTAPFEPFRFQQWKPNYRPQ